ncbi:hypothetical protein [Oxynema aestuarii]|nr:hypothetical protein [Oxynema aestuarii]
MDATIILFRPENLTPVVPSSPLDGYRGDRPLVVDRTQGSRFGG